jgi:hypothetical protein
MSRRSRRRVRQRFVCARLVAAFGRARADASPNPYTDLCRRFEFGKNARPHPCPLPQERERRRLILHSLAVTVAVGATLRFVCETVRPPDAFISAPRGRTIHPLLGERVGVRASVSPHTFLSLFHSNTFVQSDRASAVRNINSIIPVRFESSGFVVPISIFE